MEHQQATQLMAVEKYLLQELGPEVRDQFEEHFFDCQECATDLGATAAFMEAAKKGISSASCPEARRLPLRANWAWPCCGLSLPGQHLPRPCW